MTCNAFPKVLYLVYWGAAEPLGQSIVLPPVTKLAEMGAAVTLITFEKPADLARRSEIERIHATLERHRVRWVPLRYHKQPKGPAKLLDVLHGVGAGLLQAVRQRPNIVHARTFVGGVIGALLAPLVGAKLVYHAEGFYPDEQVDGGFWAEGSLPHRAARLVERYLYARADGIVVLSEQGRFHVERLPVVHRRATPVVVVPSSVDLARFPSLERSRWQSGSGLRLIYVGSIGGRYRLDRVAEFAATAFRRLGRVSLRVLTPAGHEVGEAILRASGLPQEAWSLESVAHAKVSEELSRQNAGLHFLTPGIGQHAGSPTKVGEYWASGLPVVITPGVGDTEEIIRGEGVGVVVSEFSGESYDHALSELLNLLEDPYLPSRCRAAAEKHYGLGPACESLQRLYTTLVGDRLNGHDREASVSPAMPRPDGLIPDREKRRSS